MTATGSVAGISERGKAKLLHEPPGGDPDKLTLVRARGSLVWDDEGKEYIDCTAQAWSNNLGANDPRVIEAADRAVARDHARPPDLLSLPLLRAPAKLVEIAPAGLDRVGFNLHGSPPSRWR